MTRVALLALTAALAGFAALSPWHRPARPTAGFGRLADLPRPSELSVPAFEEALFAFLNDRQYQSRGWAVDKEVRDTGSFIDGTYYGTHPTVRAYYSPGVL